MPNFTPIMCSAWADQSATPSVSNRRLKRPAACRPEKRAASCDAALHFPGRFTSGLLLLLADLGFVDRLIQMFDRLDAMAGEIMLCGLQVMFGIPHGFQPPL